jgi:hypothetical protein
VVLDGKLLAIGGHTGPHEHPDINAGERPLCTIEAWDPAGEMLLPIFMYVCIHVHVCMCVRDTQEGTRSDW